MFLIEYIKHPRMVGAIAPSGKHLADKMIKSINFAKAKCIVEYGPGTGVFTEKLLARAQDNTLIILIEKNIEFYNKLIELYGHKSNVIIINDTVDKIDSIIEQYHIKKIDYIVSGIPFTVLPKEETDSILNKTKNIISHGGEFITFQYSLIKKGVFSNIFPHIDIDKTLVNLPPAYVLRCRAELKNR